ncbi:MAG: hypothetical protein ACLS36_00445 [Streptococcus sp.]
MKPTPAKESQRLRQRKHLRLQRNHKAVTLRQNVKRVPRQKQNVVKMAEAVTTVIVTENNKEHQGKRQNNDRRNQMEMVKETVTMETAITRVIVTVSR